MQAILNFLRVFGPVTKKNDSAAWMEKGISIFNQSRTCHGNIVLQKGKEEALLRK